MNERKEGRNWKENTRTASVSVYSVIAFSVDSVFETLMDTSFSPSNFFVFVLVDNPSYANYGNLDGLVFNLLLNSKLVTPPIFTVITE